MRVLDGGWARWTAEARPTAAGDGECPLKARGDWPAARLAAPSLLADADAVRRAAAAGPETGGEAQVVDGRAFLRGGGSLKWGWGGAMGGVGVPD